MNENIVDARIVALQGVNNGEMLRYIRRFRPLLIPLAWARCLAEAFDCANQFELVLIHAITPVRIEEPVAICVGMQIELQCPDSPEYVDVPV